MSAHSPAQPTLVQVLLNDQSLVKNILLAIAGSLALWASAKIQIPFPYVPMTMQTLVVLLIGMSFGWKLGGATILLYLAEGAMGLPVFAGTPEKGLGIAYMIGSSGGYLFGFLVAAVAVGWLASKGWGRHIWSTAAAMVIGNVIIYAFGIFWLGSVVGWDKPVLAWGLTPFLLGDLVKIIIAMLALPALWRFVGRNP